MALNTRGPLSEEENASGECDCSICARVRLSLSLLPHRTSKERTARQDPDIPSPSTRSLLFSL